MVLLIVGNKNPNHRNFIAILDLPAHREPQSQWEISVSSGGQLNRNGNLLL
jgi:hypothetical protein